MALLTWLRNSASGSCRKSPRRPRALRPRGLILLERLEDRLTPASWFTFAGNPQHTGVSAVAAQPVDAIHWQTPVDLNPTGDAVHYGSPVFTPSNTVIIPIKTGANGGFEVAARTGAAGNLLWTLPSDYTLPPHSWLPPYGPTLASTGRLYFPGNGGTVYYVDNPDTPGATVSGQLAFYGIGNYLANPAGYNPTVFIDTPITADANGNIYFGFMVTGANPSGLVGGGVARIDAAGTGSYVLASAAAGDAGVSRVPLSAAPALSNDGQTLYAVLNNTSQSGGYLVVLDSTTLATRFKVALKDPRGNVNPARLIDQSTATPFVAPDNTVFMSVFGNPYNGSRGFLLHFSADLATEYLPGAFGWDDTQSIVPASAVPSYHGTSPYLIFSKYNNYVAAEVGSSGGDGVNKIALLDPYAGQPDPNNDGTPVIQVMREVLTQIGPTPDAEFINSGYPNAVREWCINDTAIDPFTKCALVNSEDGNLYRWDFTTNTLTQMVNITPGIGEPYTPTSIGPDGTVYAINGGTLTAIGGLPNYTLTDTSSQNPAAVGQSVTFTATLASTNGGPTPTGSVTFKDGATTLMTVPVVNGQAVYSTSFATAASHFITAAYGGDGTYAPGSTTLVESVRTYTTTVALSSGNLVVTDATLGGKDDNLTVQADTANGRFVFTDPLSLFVVLGSVPGAVVSADGHTVTVPFASVAGSQVQINTLAGNDRVTVDYSLGSFAAPGKAITYDGGGTLDTLTVAGATASTVTHKFIDPFSGNVRVDGGPLISYTGLYALNDNLTAATRTFNPLAGAETLDLSDNAPNDGAMEVHTSRSTFVFFSNPTVALNIDMVTGAAAGTDTAVIDSVDANFRASLTVTGRGGDSFTLNAPLTLGSATAAGNLAVSFGTITLNANVSTTAGPAAAGSVSLNTLGGSGVNVANAFITIGTNHPGLDGTITVLGPINASTANTGNLLLDADTADVSLQSVGVTRPLVSLNVFGANTLTAQAITLATGGTLAVSTAGTKSSITGVIAGSGVALTKRGTGTLALTAANTYTGGTTVQRGVLQLGNGGTTGSIPGAVAVGDGGTLAFNRSDAVTFGGAITGLGAVLKTGRGSLTLTGANSYSGGTTVARGTLLLGADGQLGAATGDVTVTSPGRLTVTAGTNSGRAFFLNGGTLAVIGGVTLTLTNAQVSGGFLVGPGKIATAAGASTAFDGTTTQSSLTLAANGNDSFTNFTAGGVMTLAAGTTATLSGFTVTSSGRLTVYGTADVSDFVSNGYVEVSKAAGAPAAGWLVNVGTSLIVLGGGSVLNIAYTQPVTGGGGPVGGTGGTQADREGRGRIDLGTGGMQALGGAVVRNNGFIDSSADQNGDPPLFLLETGSIYYYGDSLANGLGFVDLTLRGGKTTAGF